MAKKITVILILFFCVVLMQAAEISEIVFEQEAPGIQFPLDMLTYNVQSSAGLQFDKKVIDGDIKRLYSTGNFSNIDVETEEVAGGKLKVIFKIKAKPRIAKIIFEGNKKYPEEKFKDCVSLVQSGPLNDTELQESLKKLRAFYVDKGHHEATITPETKDAGNGEVDLYFKINENLRKKINSVTFIGNTIFSSWRLKGTIESHHSYLSWLFNTGLFNPDELDKDKEKLRDLYWTKGYLDFNVENVEVKEVPDDPEYVDLTFVIHEGDPYKIQEVSVVGNTVFPSDEIVKELKLKTDETFDILTEQKDIENISDMYYPLGYVDFICKPVRVPDFATKTVNIEYRITEGAPFTVRDLNISGNYNTKDYVIRREMAIQPGDPVDKNRIDASKSRLMGMNYFEKADIVTVGTDDPKTKDVNVAVEEKDTAKFSIGAGMSDTDSLVGMIEISQINFDISDPSNYFVGGGQRASLRAQYGIERADFDVNFSEPWLFNRPLRLDLSGYYNNRKWDDWSESHGGGRISLTKRFLEFNTISLGYTLENVRIYDMSKKLSEMFQDQKGSDIVSKLSLQLARDTRNDMFEPTDGYFLSGLGEINTKFLGASKNYYRLEAVGSNYITFFDCLTLHTGLKVGQTQSIGTSDLVPLYDRYFLGGGDTIRGFPYRSISPLDKNNDRYGGESMLIGNVEVTHPIYKFIKGAVFADIGNVWKRAWNFQIQDINMGVGYGLRIKIPYINAPVKLDLAYPIIIGQKDVSRKIRFHFNVGFTWSPN